MAVSLVLADGHPVVLEGLRLIYAERGFDVVATAVCGEEAAALCEELEPTLLICEIALAGMDGFDTCQEVLRRCPKTRVIFFASRSDEQSLARAIRSGASGFLLKDCSLDELATAIRLAAAGETVIAPQLKPHLLAQVRRPAANDLSYEPKSKRITARETEVLQLIADGHSTAEIAERLFVSQTTIKDHLASIYQKLDARDRTQAVLTAMRLGIVALD